MRTTIPTFLRYSFAILLLCLGASCSKPGAAASTLEPVRCGPGTREVKRVCESITPAGTEAGARETSLTPAATVQPEATPDTKSLLAMFHSDIKRYGFDGIFLTACRANSSGCMKDFKRKGSNYVSSGRTGNLLLTINIKVSR